MLKKTLVSIIDAVYHCTDYLQNSNKKKQCMLPSTFYLSNTNLGYMWINIIKQSAKNSEQRS